VWRRKIVIMIGNVAKMRDATSSSAN
jgi:hypothetical protein